MLCWNITDDIKIKQPTLEKEVELRLANHKAAKEITLNFLIHLCVYTIPVNRNMVTAVNEL